MSNENIPENENEKEKPICVFKTIKPSSTKDADGQWHRNVDENGKQIFDNIAFLFRSQDPEKTTLWGNVTTADGVKHNVLGFITERKEEGKGNFINLCIKDDESGKLIQVGNINAINARKDGKPVYFDEAIIKINDELINTKVGNKVDPELHKTLGFTSPRQERPKYEPGDDYKDKASDKAKAAEKEPPTPSGDEADKPNKPVKKNKAKPK